MIRNCRSTRAFLVTADLLHGAARTARRTLPCSSRAGTLERVQTRAQIKALLEDEAVVEGETETLPVELDAIPGAVWQMELHSLMPPDIRVSLFERGSRKCALLKFPRGGAEQAFQAFETALQAANEVSHELHQSAAQAARDALRQA